MYGKELQAENANNICLPQDVDTFILKISEIYLRNLDIRYEEVSVPTDIVVSTPNSICTKTISVPAKRFIFTAGHIRSLLCMVLQATGQLDGLKNYVDSGGIINVPDGQKYGGGFDIIIQCQQDDE